MGSGSGRGSARRESHPDEAAATISCRSWLRSGVGDPVGPSIWLGGPASSLCRPRLCRGNVVNVSPTIRSGSRASCCSGTKYRTTLSEALPRRSMPCVVWLRRVAEMPGADAWSAWDSPCPRTTYAVAQAAQRVPPSSAAGVYGMAGDRAPSGCGGSPTVCGAAARRASGAIRRGSP